MIKFDPSKKIAFVCPGTPSTQEEVKQTADYLQSVYQLTAIYQEDVHQILPAKQRAEIFLNYLFDPNIALLWALRGGEGSADIIPFLHQQKNKIAKLPPKLMLGFSDFTPILIYFSQTLGWPTIHGICARQLILKNINQMTEEKTLDWLLGKCATITVPNLTPYNEKARISTLLNGTMIGGNLSLLSICPKESWELKCDNKIVLIEEVNEMPYKIARMLKYLNRIDLFKDALAIIFCGFNFDADKFTNTAILEQSVSKILSEFSKTCHCPVLFTPKISHAQNNLPITFSMPATLALGNKPCLTVIRKF